MLGSSLLRLVGFSNLTMIAESKKLKAESYRVLSSTFVLAYKLKAYRPSAFSLQLWEPTSNLPAAGRPQTWNFKLFSIFQYENERMSFLRDGSGYRERSLSDL